MPERSKGEVLRTFVLNHSWVRTPLLAHRFRSVEVSTGGFDPPILGSNPGGTKFFFVQVPERSKGLVLGTSVFALAGSNPVLHNLAAASSPLARTPSTTAASSPTPRTAGTALAS